MTQKLFFCLLLLLVGLTSCSYEEDTILHLTPAQLQQLETSELTSFNFWIENKNKYFNTKYKGINSTLLLAKNNCLVTLHDTIDPLFQYEESPKNWWTDFISINKDTFLASDSITWVCTPVIVKKVFAMYQAVDSLKIQKISSTLSPAETTITITDGETYLFTKKTLDYQRKKDWKILAPNWYILQDYKSITPDNQFLNILEEELTDTLKNHD